MASEKADGDRRVNDARNEEKAEADRRVTEARREEQTRLAAAAGGTSRAVAELGRLRVGLEHVAVGTMMPAQLQGLLSRIDRALTALGAAPPSSP